MTLPGRSTTTVVAVLALAVVVAGLVWWIGRGEAPEDVADDYLSAAWHGDDETACELATEPWRHVLYDGQPYADCTAYAEAAEKARSGEGFPAFEPDTDILVTTELVSEDAARARVQYAVELRYHGDDRAGFERLWQGGGAVDRGTVELVEADGEWRIAGVDAG